jgi:hypothetical protein
VAVQACGAHGLVGLTGKRWKPVDDSGAHGGRQRRRKLHCPALVAGALGRNSVQEVHGIEALLLDWSDGTGRLGGGCRR